MVYQRGEDNFIGGRGVVAYVSESATVDNLLDYEDKYIQPRAGQEYYVAAAELGQFDIIGGSCSCGQEEAGPDWNDTEGEIRRSIATHRGIRRPRCLKHAAGDSNWVTFYRGGYLRYVRVSPLHSEGRRSLSHYTRQAYI